jgi:hypothetical protein
MGVLTHLDGFRDAKRLKKTKKALKHRFWAEIYQGTAGRPCLTLACLCDRAASLCDRAASPSVPGAPLASAASADRRRAGGRVQLPAGRDARGVRRAPPGARAGAPRLVTPAAGPARGRRRQAVLPERRAQRQVPAARGAQPGALHRGAEVPAADLAPGAPVPAGRPLRGARHQLLSQSKTAWCENTRSYSVPWARPALLPAPPTLSRRAVVRVVGQRPRRGACVQPPCP